MRRIGLVAILTTLALLVAGCGDDDEGTVAQESDSPGEPESTEEESASPVVELQETPLGEILVDAEGRTLYVFTNDSPGESTCAEACADLWPPVEAPSELAAGEGVDEALVGTITRSDGASQLTYADAPLYRYSKDEAPGDTNGQNVGGVWFVVGADGKPITAPAASGASY